MVTSTSGITTPFGEPVERVFTNLSDPAGWLVIDADRPELADLLPGVAASVILYSRNGSTELVREHVAGGGSALIAEFTDDIVTFELLTNDPRPWSTSINTSGNTESERARINPGVVLPAIAAAIAQEIPREVVQRVILQHIGEAINDRAGSQPKA